MRFFNTAGPVRCEDHYCLPPLGRFDLDEVRLLIDQRKYFVLHAPRQTGKTTCLLALAEYLNREGRYRALYANVEIGQSARENVEAAMRAIVGEISSRARDFLGDAWLGETAQEVLRTHGGHAALSEVLTRWVERSPKPIVLMLDEVDALVGDTLISFLRQLRAGYDKRPAFFPSTIILCGVRDVRDYRIYSDETKSQITGGSAFNIKAESLRLGDFSAAEASSLLEQHTAETGQPFEPAALDAVWDLTAGQPWLVNALAYETCFKMKPGRDRPRPITADMIFEAKENLILRRETHLDQLADKLKEPRVRRVVEPMLRGVELERTVELNDLQYVADLGLVRRTSAGPQISNAIYREIIPRELTYIAQLNFESTTPAAWYVRPDGRLDMNQLLEAFQQFFREHSESWLQLFDYQEAGPQLLMQAFLQRIVNGGGRVEREYGLGRRRTDLLVIWPAAAQRSGGPEEQRGRGAEERRGGGAGEQGSVFQHPASSIQHPASSTQRAVIELKILYGSLERTLADGLAQTWEYADRCGADEAHLVIFDHTPGKAWDEKIFRRAEAHRERQIIVWGM